jgi:hypothetical protein
MYVGDLLMVRQARSNGQTCGHRVLIDRDPRIDHPRLHLFVWIFHEVTARRGSGLGFERGASEETDGVDGDPGTVK